MQKGRCCCKYPNEKGAKIVQIIDIIFIVNLPRWIFAVWAKVDDEKWLIYSRMRLVSFWVFWIVILLALVTI